VGGKDEVGNYNKKWEFCHVEIKEMVKYGGMLLPFSIA
jgi:hypothetical protein